MAYFGMSLMSLLTLATVPDWKNPDLPMETRVSDLIGRMTDDELFSQLSNSQTPFQGLTQGYEWGQECLSGFQTKMWATSDTNYATFPTSAFPQAVSLGMSFDQKLVRSVAAAIGAEVRAGFHHHNRSSLHCQSPVLNVARDPRWGRCMESYGEDPTHISILGSAYIDGMQHGDIDAPETHYLQVAASPKHFADYNLECTCFKAGPNCDPLQPKLGCHAPTGVARTEYDATVTAHDMRETYLAGFKGGAKVGMQGVMCSVNSVNGIPLCAHEELLNGILRGEFNMSGTVISDGDTVANIYGGNGTTLGHMGHHYAHSWTGAAADALRAGCDMSWDENLAPNLRYGEPTNGTARTAVLQHLVNMSLVRKAVSNTLRPRFRVGLYDPLENNPWAATLASIILSPKHVSLAVRAARESPTLLKNNNNALPLLHPKAIGVVGAAANDTFLSIDRYTGEPDPQHISMFLTGITERALRAGTKVVSCEHLGDDPRLCAQYLKNCSVDHVVFVVTCDTEGEQHDRASLGLREDQQALVEAVADAIPGSDAKRILAIVSGGAVSTEKVTALVDAEVWIGKTGMQAGTGFAALLFGDYDFSGRVAATIYKEAWLNYSSFVDNSISGGSKGRGYRYNLRDDLVQYSFGWGLSYSSYRSQLDIDTFQISAEELSVGKTISVPITVMKQNQDDYTFIRSVLLYLENDGDDISGLPKRRKWLANFTKVTGALKEESITTHLNIGQDALGRWIPKDGASSQSFSDGKYSIVKGTYRLHVSDSTSVGTVIVI